MRARQLSTIGLLIAVVIGGATVAGASAAVSAAPRVIPVSTTVVSSPDGDLFADAGERIIGLAVEIRNVGDAPATGITATLVSPNPVQYPDLAPGATATNMTPFTVAVPSSFTCGDGYEMTLRVNTQQGAFGMGVVAPVSSVGRPESWTSATPIDIPDLATVESPLTLGAGTMATILDLNVRINDLSHTWVGDLSISLLDPSGGVVNLADHRGAGAHFTNTVFDDEAGTAIADGSPPFTGTFRSDSLRLYQRDGDDATGTWRLRVRDDVATDTGRLNSWSIDAVTARCNEAPTATFATTPRRPIVGRPVVFTAAAADRDGRVVSQAWDLDNDRQFDDGTGTTAKRTFATPRPVTVWLRVVDDLGNAKVVAKRVHPVRVCRVPRVIGLKLAAAVRAIRRGGCRIGRVRQTPSPRAGRVLSQRPRGGVQRRYGTRVNLVVGRR